MRRLPTWIAITIASLGASAWAGVTVRDVRLIDYRIERTKAFVTAKAQSDSCYGIFVLVTGEDDAGKTFTGLGDALPRGLVTNETLADAWAGAGAMAETLKGRSLAGTDRAADVATLRQWVDDLDRVAAGQKLTTAKPPPADKQLRATLCGFDEALLDMAAQVHGVPIYELLGGKQRDSVTVSAMTYNADASSDDLADKADANDGAYGAMRLKVGLGDDEDVKKIGAVAAELVKEKQPTQLWIDVNMAWHTPEQAIAMLGRIRDALAAAKFTSTFICEQPTDDKDLAALAAVTKEVRKWNAAAPFKIVVMADEAVWTLSDVKKMVELDAADALNIKLQKCGGLLAAKDIGDYLKDNSPHTQVYVGGVIATDVTSWANLQACVALPRLDWATACIPRRSYPTNVAATPIAYTKGKTFSLPTSPGLGTALATDKLKRYTRRDTAIPATRPAN